MTARNASIAGILLAFALAIMVPSALVAQQSQSQQPQSQQPQSLRGDADLKSTNAAGTTPKQNRSQSALARAYRQQPPLIPHKIDAYEIDLKVNQCMGCHDWPRNVEVGAPKISETHYISRDGVALDRVAETRWFCNQCHVPQADAEPLVANRFKNATQVGK